MVANIKKQSVHIYKIPDFVRDEMKQAFENGEWFWLIRKWNEYQVTTQKICATCPDSIKIVQAYLPELWEQT